MMEVILPDTKKQVLRSLLKYLSNGGVYIIEDMLTSYLKGWGENPNLKKR